MRSAEPDILFKTVYQREFRGHREQLIQLVKTICLKRAKQLVCIRFSSEISVFSVANYF